MVSAAACIAPRTLSSAKVFRTASNSILPARPPSTAPSARAVLVLSCSFTPSFLPLTRELIDMPNTVQPEQKLTVDTGKIPSISKSGLMMIPPPAPTIEPILDARIQTIKRIKGITHFSLLRSLSRKVFSLLSRSSPYFHRHPYSHLRDSSYTDGRQPF